MECDSIVGVSTSGRHLQDPLHLHYSDLQILTLSLPWAFWTSLTHTRRCRRPKSSSQAQDLVGPFCKQNYKDLGKFQSNWKRKWAEKSSLHRYKLFNILLFCSSVSLHWKCQRRTGILTHSTQPSTPWLVIPSWKFWRPQGGVEDSWDIKLFRGKQWIAATCYSKHY